MSQPRVIQRSFNLPSLSQFDGVPKPFAPAVPPAPMTIDVRSAQTVTTLAGFNRIRVTSVGSGGMGSTTGNSWGGAGGGCAQVGWINIGGAPITVTVSTSIDGGSYTASNYTATFTAGGKTYTLSAHAGMDGGATQALGGTASGGAVNVTGSNGCGTSGYSYGGGAAGPGASNGGASGGNGNTASGGQYGAAGGGVAAPGGTYTYSPANQPQPAANYWGGQGGNGSTAGNAGTGGDWGGGGGSNGATGASGGNGGVRIELC